jgi:Protein of unknown function (DUF3768)
MSTNRKTARIRELNDAFRRSFMGGRVVMTSGIDALPDGEKAQVLNAVRTFTDFDEGNDPHGEHDFGAIEIGAHRVFFKIDYYDVDMRFGSDDPSDPSRTTRVMTIMLASEY